LIHRDIKPANIMLCNQGGQVDVAKVLDFGLVKEMDSQSPQLTQANSITGTPLYMPPETLKDPSKVDARSDLYALAAVAYYMLVGDHVFSGGSIIEVCSKHLNDAPTPPSSRMDAPPPPALEALILQCLEKSADERPGSAREFAKRLAQCEVEPWTTEKAEVWWLKHSQRISLIRAKPTGTSQTIQVDLGRRGSV
jgi:serine/threonine-protein kinase